MPTLIDHLPEDDRHHAERQQRPEAVLGARGDQRARAATSAR